MAKTRTFGAFEAKTHFSELLELISQGAEITITKHEKPVARLVPVTRPMANSLEATFKEMAKFRKKYPLNPKGSTKLTYRELIDEGRHI